MSEAAASEGQRAQTVRVRYETTEVSFVSQFLVSRTDEEVVVSCSPGYLADPQGGGSVLPVNCRLGLTLPGARRLVETLQRVLAEPAARAAPGRGETAGLPPLD